MCPARCIRLALFLVLGLSLGHPHRTGEIYQLQIPLGLTRGNEVDGSFVSYSVEFSYMKDYAGNLSYVACHANRLQEVDTEQDIRTPCLISSCKTSLRPPGPILSYV